MLETITHHVQLEFQDSVSCSLSPANTPVKSAECPAKCTCDFFPLKPVRRPVADWWLVRCTFSSAFGFNKEKQSTPQIVEAFFPGELDNPDGSLQLHSNYVIAKLLQNHGNHSAASYPLQLQPNVLR